jgi:AAA domain
MGSQLAEGQIDEALRIAARTCPDATDGELRQLFTSYRARNLPGLITDFARNGRLARDLSELRETRTRADTAAVVRDALRYDSNALCPHGKPGGSELHPQIGRPLCPLCRAEYNSAAGNSAAAEDSSTAPGSAGDSAEQVPAGESRRLVVTAASSIRPRPVWWGWDERAPAGHVTLLAGREGIGKSLFVIDLTAKVTRGTLPGVFCGTPRPVFYVATEDSWQHTIVPRLIAAGADLDLVYRVEGQTIETHSAAGTTVELSLPRDCALLAAEIRQRYVAMVVLDPLMSTVDRSVDTYNDREMRTVLEPLGRLADETGCMIIGLAHFNKSGDADPLNLVTGSRAFTAVVRAVIAIARDPDAEDGRCIVSQVKNNLGRLNLPNLTYVIDTAIVETDEGDACTGRLRFTGESDKSVRDILANLGNIGDLTARAECAEWLREFLAEPRRSKELADGAREHGHALRTLARARKQLSVKTEQRPTGPNGKNEWWAYLSQDPANDS